MTNPAYLFYIFIGNVVAWPLSIFFTLFSDLSRFLCFATSALIAGLIGALVVSAELYTAHFPVVYLVIGATFAISVFIDGFRRESYPEILTLLYSAATGICTGLAIGYLF